MFEYSPRFYHFSELALIWPFFGSHPNSFSILARILPFPGTRSYSTIFRYSHWLDPFPVLNWIVLRYSHGFYHVRVLARILPFFGTSTHWNLFRFSPEQFFDTRTDSTFSRDSPVFYHFSELPLIGPFSVLTRTIFQYSHGFYHFSELALIGPFFGSRPNSFSILARILPFPGTRRILPFFGTQPNSFSILARILPFPGTRPYSTIFRNSQ